MNLIKYNAYNEIILLLISMLSHDLRQMLSFDFLDKMDPYWWKRFAIEFRRKKKGKVLQKLQSIFVRLKTKQLRNFDAALAELLLIERGEKDVRRERVLAEFLSKSARTIPQYSETLEHAQTFLEQSEIHTLLDKMFEAVMNYEDKYEYQEEMLVFLQITVNMPSYQAKREQINLYWAANNETLVGVPAVMSMYD